MKRKYFLLWILSVALIVISVIPFFRFMFALSTHNLVIILLFLVPGAALYVVSDRKLTHPKGYSLFNAMQFYNLCKKNGLADIKVCRRNPEKVMELASHNDYAQKLNLTDIYEMYEIGYEFVVERGLNS